MGLIFDLSLVIDPTTINQEHMLIEATQLLHRLVSLVMDWLLRWILLGVHTRVHCGTG